MGSQVLWLDWADKRWVTDLQDGLYLDCEWQRGVQHDPATDHQRDCGQPAEDGSPGGERNFSSSPALMRSGHRQARRSWEREARGWGWIISWRPCSTMVLATCHSLITLPPVDAWE